MITGEKLLELIPQRPPMVLIDQLIDCSPKGAKTSFEVPEDHVLVENNKLKEPGLVENMAQSAAAQAGFLLKESGKTDGAPIGFIGAIKGLKINALPNVGTRIYTEVNLTHQVMNASVVDCSITQDDNEIASCQLKIFLQE